MNCPEHTQYDLLVMDLLERPLADALLAHARVCPRCRSRFDQSRRAHAQRIRMYEAFDRDHEQLREQLMAALPDGAPQAPRRGRLGGIIMSMNARTIRRTAAILAPAACVLLALVLYVTPSNNVALADVIANLRRAQTMVCRVTTYIGGDQPVSTGAMYLSEAFGSRVEFDTPGQGRVVMVRPLGGEIHLIDETGESAVSIDTSASDQLVGSAPADFIAALRGWTGDADRELGRKEIDGRQAEGFEIDGDRLGFSSAPGAHSSARVWVDVKTALPVLIELETTSPDGQNTYVRQDQFVWDTPLEAKLFELDIPAGTQEVDVALPPADEATLLAGLERYAVLSDGAYPPSLRVQDVVGSVAGAIASGVAQQPEGKETLPAELMSDVFTLQQMCAFYQRLVEEGRDPEYFGANVTSEDGRAVLLRWRIDENAKRVIYADLHAETIASPGT
ncbi:MAG: hypothetical protein D6744_03795 [Planctomycetota bacterium]|nr:MAG: hypothetical protein D6744_03795 [Planctomycetota bacterium]